jgi:hypothetical protein
MQVQSCWISERSCTVHTLRPISQNFSNRKLKFPFFQDVGAFGGLRFDDGPAVERRAGDQNPELPEADGRQRRRGSLLRPNDVGKRKIREKLWVTIILFFYHFFGST